MKTYKHLYPALCSLSNLELAFANARKGKTTTPYIAQFEKDLYNNLKELQHELLTLTYTPKPLRRFIIRDPKTRVIHSSSYRDRGVHHAIINILEPIFEPIFIYDSYASRKGKGVHKAVERFDYFKRKVSKNGQRIKDSYTNNNVQGYVLKADIKHYFNTIDHEILLSILKRKIQDDQVISLITKVLNNFDGPIKGKGMPLGNYTSQFFGNVYLNDFDYFVKHHLKAKYYIRYVDDFVIVHSDKKVLEDYKEKIEAYFKNLKLELHPDKSKIIPLRIGITFLGYRIFYHYKLLRKANLRKFYTRFTTQLASVRGGGRRGIRSPLCKCTRLVWLCQACEHLQTKKEDTGGGR